jgi:photosystem II stability/assembly factor-like uncharacterized protein
VTTQTVSRPQSPKSRGDRSTVRTYFSTVSLSLLLTAGLLVAIAGAGLSSVDPSGAWQAQKSGTTQPLYGAACLTAVRCKVVGAAGTVLSTSNGGATWRSQRNPLQGTSAILYRIACIAPSTCYVIARPNTIMLTHDSGATWSTHVIPVPGIGAGLSDPTCLGAQAYDNRGRLTVCRVGLLDIACINARACFVVATPMLPPSNPTGTSCVTATRCAVVGKPSTIWLTHDGGVTWVRQVIPPTVPCQADCANQTFPYPLEWISCLRSGVCRAGGTRFMTSHEGFAQAVIETTQPGTPWRLLNPGDSRFSPDDARCPTTTVCYGVYTSSHFDPGTSVEISRDAGATWQGTPSGSNRLRYGIACSTHRTCYTVGNRGTITGTTNGKNFFAQDSPTSHDLYGIKCLSATTCYAVGNRGSIVARR